VPLSARHLAALACGLVACSGPSVHEDVVTERQVLELAVQSEPVLWVVVLDDTEFTYDVWGRFDNGSAGMGEWLLDSHPAAELGLLSGYSDIPPRWMGGHPIQAVEDHVQFNLQVREAWSDGIIRRSVYEPSPRSAIANAITSGLLQPPEEAPPTVFLIMSAFDDHSPEEDVEVVREYMETTQYGTVWELMIPKGGECRGPSSTERAGHDRTREALRNVSFLGEFEVCAEVSEGEWAYSATSTEHRINRAEAVLPEGVVADTISVWGLDPDGDVRIPEDQLLFDPPLLEILPPVAQFPELEVRYDVRYDR